MGMATPKHSNQEINRAGSVLRSTDASSAEKMAALDVINNWRACHYYPINTFQANLRRHLNIIDLSALVGQRLKRVSSVESKLKRFKSMDLARMQDIGGLRAIVQDIATVRQLEERYEKSRFDHKLVRKDDYIQNPKSSGYRGIHLVYRYKGKGTAEIYNGLMIEMQIRTRLQHAWATAVETMGTFLNQSLKSSEGQKHWLEFFAITGSAFAHMEKTQPLSDFLHLSEIETYRKVAELENDLQIIDKLSTYNQALKIINDEIAGSYHYYVLFLRPSSSEITITGFKKDQLEKATDLYLETEKTLDGNSDQAVLVAVESIDLLRRAYPNYFLDTHEFLEQLRQIKEIVDSN